MRELSYVEICLTDNPMDASGTLAKPLNARVQKCPVCTFPDLDHVPQPYLIGRGISKPADLDLADLGNLFARDRARQVIEVVCPGQCDFYPTFEKSKKTQTGWWLVVPHRKVVVGRVKDEIPRCPACGEPKVAHWGSQYDWSDASDALLPATLGADLAKSENWISSEYTEADRAWIAANYKKANGKNGPPPTPPSQWQRIGITRWTYLSVRLERLFKKLGLRGIVRTSGQKTSEPTSTDLAWVDEQIARLAKLGLAEATGVKAEEAQSAKWFASYVKKHAVKGGSPVDFSACERQIGKPLPASYKTLVSKLGPRTFKNIEDTEGFDVTIVGPDQVDARSFRKGAFELEPDDVEGRAIDGICFATTGFGDCFCFDIAHDGPEYPVFRFQHEMNCYEAYASDFPSFVKQLAGK